MRGLSISFSSLRTKLTVAILLFSVPLVTLLWVLHLSAVDVVREQVARSSQKLLGLHMRALDADLEELDRFLYDLSVSNVDVQRMDRLREANEMEYDMARLRLFNTLKHSVENYRNTDIIFVLSERNNDVLMVGRTDYGSTFEERSNLRSEIQLMLDSGLQQSLAPDWRVWRSESGKFYVYRLVKTGSTCLGAWVRADKLIQPLELLDDGDKGIALLATLDMEPMQHADQVAAEGIDLNYDENTFLMSGDKASYLVLGERSEKGAFHLIAVIPESAILQQLPYLKRLAFIATVGACIFPLMLAWYLRKVFLLPILRLVSAMRRLSDGNWQTRLELGAASDEFRLMNNTFNRMIEEIRNLKIDVYEEKLNHQRAELKQLQLQINPHFFLNSLNIIYNLATVRDFAVIQEMTKCLVAYFRFIFQSDAFFVLLRDELAHTRNYLRIQQLRFPQRLTFRIEADEDALNSPIPPLVIQNVVENSIKHAVNLDDTLDIQIRVASVGKGSERRLCVRIADNGPGFPPEVLGRLQQGRDLVQDEGERIGIWNLRHRLKLLYPAGYRLAFENGSEGGAVVTMELTIEGEGGTRNVPHIAG
jgi:Predicted signal transduction protein with a C-terminal ATPase domain